MIKLTGDKISSSKFDRHSYICDLINFEGPFLSLYKDEHSDWLYLWSDTDGKNTDRWLIFQITRGNLLAYLKKHLSLRELLIDATPIYSLDKRVVIEQNQTKPTTYRQIIQVSAGQLEEYWPDEDSFFDESLTPDIATAREIAPAVFEIPIGGNWFLQDITGFSKSYTRIYSFLYCTQPRFVTNLAEKVKRYLKSPWKGGYSRVNFFDALHRQIPSIHDMRVAGYRYNSPGEIKIEALDSVGEDVNNLVLRYISQSNNVEHSVKLIDNALGAARVRKEDLSRMSDSGLFIAENHLNTIKNQIEEISILMNLSKEINLVKQASPNSVVTAKVVLALLKQLKRISDYQTKGMLDLAREPSR
ncbi:MULTISPECIES: hypothetical protein [Variovorax]|jgi:hypothetical protein|nr:MULTISPECIES: hypothetical protein [Variovorax]UKI09604.1 hypothetical protein L3V85_07075 [Variovorax paradoxus]